MDSLKQNKNNSLNLPKKVGVIYSDARREYFPTETQYLTEKDALKDAQTIASYLVKMGIKVQLFPGNACLPEQLRLNKPNMVLNLVDSVKGNEYLAATIPAVLELLEIPYTGSGMLGRSLDCNKFLLKKLFQENNVPIPHYQLFNTFSEPLDPTLRFPLISKLNEIHGAVEITKNAISENEKHLRERLQFLIKTYKQAVIVEEFIAGREITAILLEGLNKKIYLAEKVFHNQKDKYVFMTFKDQWEEGSQQSIHYQKYEDRLLREYVRKAFEVSGMADYIKFDIRLDISGRYFFLDCNSNPALGPKEEDVAIGSILDLHGVSFFEILKRLLLNTMKDKNESDTP